MKSKLFTSVLMLMTAFAFSQVNIGMDFDGIDDHLSIPSAPLFNPSASLSIAFEGWIKPDLTKEFNTIISKGAGGAGQTAYIFETHNSSLRLFLGSSSGGGEWFVADTPLTSNIWTHVAVFYDHTNASVTFYIDGEFDNNEIVIFSPYSADTESVFIGRQGYTCSCNFFKGQMDEIRIWNSYNSLIRSFWGQELTGSELNLLVNFNFSSGIPEGDNSALTIVPDISPNGHHGALSGFTQTGTTSNWVTVPSLTLSTNDNASLFNEIVVYPNPTYSTVNIDLGEKYQNITLDIYDIMGKRVHNVSYSNINTITLNAEHLKSGLYLVKLNSENSHAVLKLVIK